MRPALHPELRLAATHMNCQSKDCRSARRKAAWILLSSFLQVLAIEGLADFCPAYSLAISGHTRSCMPGSRALIIKNCMHPKTCANGTQHNCHEAGVKAGTQYSSMQGCSRAKMLHRGLATSVCKCPALLNPFHTGKTHAGALKRKFVVIFFVSPTHGSRGINFIVGEPGIWGQPAFEVSHDSSPGDDDDEG